MTSVTVGDHDIEVSHPDKVLFPEAGLTKADLVAYYRRVADHMLPHVRQRLVALERFPDGIDADGSHRKDQRDRRLFVDTNRNGYAQHAAAAYTVRARPGAPVAAPLDWDEATSSGFDPQRYTITNIFRRLAQKPDPWSGFHDTATGLSGARRRLEAHMT